MPSNHDPQQKEILREDLQIVQVTLETISGDVRRFSGHAADAIEEAVGKLERAQHEFARASDA